MRYKCEAERPDQTRLLGKELSPRENQLYRLIYFHSFQGPVSMEKLYKEMYGDTIFNRTVAGVTICVLIGKLRAKLGEEAIITKQGLGYLAKRAVIECPREESNL